MVKKSGVSPKGAFIYFAVDDPQSFYKNYVETGKDITLNLPFTVKQQLAGEFENVAYEIDFGNAYATKVVKNNIPPITPKKDVVISDKDLTSLDNHNIAFGSYFDYRLEGPKLNAGNGDPLFAYGFKDDYDQAHDQYTGQYKVILTTDVRLKDGTLLKAGTDVTKYVAQTLDEANGIVHYEFLESFLKQIDTDKSSFGADAFIQMKRIAAGDVANTYISSVNGVDYTSNTVHTHTDEPKKPEVPVTPTTPATPVTPVTPAQPQTPAKPATPAPKSPAMPQTGDQQQSGLSLVGAILLAVSSFFGALGLSKRRKATK